MKKMDYYEFLQISPNAEEETIHRVYRFLAARYHPDNPTTGDADQFAILTRAYEVLSDPARRAQYDTAREKEQVQNVPLSNSIDFMDQIDGETNRRLALLAVLYYKRRSNPHTPEVALAEVETRMGFPRDYLDFTTWYLQKKGYVTRADNSDFTLTAEGVDFVETQRVSIPILNKLLTPGEMGPVQVDGEKSPEAEKVEESLSAPADEQSISGETSVRAATSGKGRRKERRAPKEDRRANPVERREAKQDRRQGKPDWRANPIERRVNIVDRRRSATDRRSASADRRVDDSKSQVETSAEATQE